MKTAKKKTPVSKPTTSLVRIHDEMREAVCIFLEKEHLKALEWFRQRHWSAEKHDRIKNEQVLMDVIAEALARPNEVSHWMDRTVHYAKTEGFRDEGAPGDAALERSRINGHKAYAKIKSARLTLV